MHCTTECNGASWFIALYCLFALSMTSSYLLSYKIHTKHTCPVIWNNDQDIHFWRKTNVLRVTLSIRFLQHIRLKKTDKHCLQLVWWPHVPRRNVVTRLSEGLGYCRVGFSYMPHNDVRLPIKVMTEDRSSDRFQRVWNVDKIVTPRQFGLGLSHQ